MCNHLLRYDYKLAYESGVKGSIIKDLNDLGYWVVQYERLDEIECALIEVENWLDNKPAYITELMPLWVFNDD